MVMSLILHGQISERIREQIVEVPGGAVFRSAEEPRSVVTPVKRRKCAYVLQLACLCG